MGIGGRSIGRKGMSPLIATVLLMAFAVALGALIMNWTIDSVASGECENIQVQVNRLCTEDGKVLLTMRNEKQSATLNEVQLSFTQGGFENTLRIRESKIEQGEPLEVQIPTAIQPGTRVQLIGVVGSESNPIICSQKPFYTLQSIEMC